MFPVVFECCWLFDAQSKNRQELRYFLRTRLCRISCAQPRETTKNCSFSVQQNKYRDLLKNKTLLCCTRDLKCQKAFDELQEIGKRTWDSMCSLRRSNLEQGWLWRSCYPNYWPNELLREEQREERKNVHMSGN